MTINFKSMFSTNFLFIDMELRNFLCFVSYQIGFFKLSFRYVIYEIWHFHDVNNTNKLLSSTLHFLYALRYCDKIVTDIAFLQRLSFFLWKWVLLIIATSQKLLRLYINYNVSKKVIYKHCYRHTLNSEKVILMIFKVILRFCTNSIS